MERNVAKERQFGKSAGNRLGRSIFAPEPVWSKCDTDGFVERGHPPRNFQLMSPNLSVIVERRRLSAPARTPQALAWDAGVLWMSSRDEQRIYGVNAEGWTVVEEARAPGIPWGAVAVAGAVYFTSGEGPEDDRYLRRYQPGSGFEDGYRVALPEFTGSYLSHDGESLYVSQWYKHRVLQLDPDGSVRRVIPIGAEICGHTFVEGRLYVLRGTEQHGESWHLARLDLREAEPAVEELAQVPFACRSLTHDGEAFWTNHRAANEVVSFVLPGV